jgi:hypothetical protein
MKRKLIFPVMVLVLTSIVAIQSCKKESPVEPTLWQAAVPAVGVPANNAIIAFTAAGQSINLSWDGTATATPKWDVYFSKDAHPKLAASGISTNSYTAKIGTTGGVYYWQVVTLDANNIETASPIWKFDVNSAPGATTLSAPAANATAISCTPALKWRTTKDAEGDALTYDLYLGTSSTSPASFSSGLTDTTLTVSTALSAFTDYYWKVITKDPYGGSSTSAIWKFTTGALPVTTYTGSYKCDEPAEAYSYTVAFTMVDTKTIKTTNYWNSAWTGTFTLDLTNLTYTMPFVTFATNWTGTEAGILDPATGTMTGTYTIWYKGVINEQGVHTYTKK